MENTTAPLARDAAHAPDPRILAAGADAAADAAVGAAGAAGATSPLLMGLVATVLVGLIVLFAQIGLTPGGKPDPDGGYGFQPHWVITPLVFIVIAAGLGFTAWVWLGGNRPGTWSIVVAVLLSVVLAAQVLLSRRIDDFIVRWSVRFTGVLGVLFLLGAIADSLMADGTLPEGLPVPQILTLGAIALFFLSGAVQRRGGN